MDEKILKFLEKNIPEIYKYISMEENENSETQKSDKELFFNELPNFNNKKLRLLYAICNVESSNSKEAIKDVVRAAAAADDFVTALYWHEKLFSSIPQGVSEKFERYFYSLLAEEQKKKETEPKPVTSSKQLLCYPSETSHSLKNPEYYEIEARYHEKEKALYRQELLSDYFINTKLKSAQKKRNRLDAFAVLFMLLCWGAGGVGLWKTVPVVWNWVGNALFQLIVTALYIVVFVAVTIVVSTLFFTAGDNSLKKFFLKQKVKIDNKVHQSEEYIALQKMNQGLRESYCSYPGRLILAALSAMTGEKDLGKLCDIAQKSGHTWLRNKYSSFSVDSYNRNKNVIALACENATDAELAKAFVLYGSAADREKLYLSGAKEERPDFLDVIIRHCKLDLPLRFLEAECETAYRQGNRSYMGEVCYRLYDMGIITYDYSGGGKQDMHDIAFHYGILGVDYSDKLKFRVMKEYAVYEETRNYKLCLGFYREDAEAYCKELYKNGDPRWQEMRKALDDAKKYDENFVRERDYYEARKERAAQLAELRKQEEEKQARRCELEKKADRFERDVDIMRGGSGHTMEELRIGGKVSDVDAQRYKDLRDCVLDDL